MAKYHRISNVTGADSDRFAIFAAGATTVLARHRGMMLRRMEELQSLEEPRRERNAGIGKPALASFHPTRHRTYHARRQLRVGLLRRLGKAAMLFIGMVPAGALAQNASGAALFKQKCSVCHTNSANGRSAIAPDLKGVGGRPAASAQGFVYSTALKKSGLTWTGANLDRFLQAPNRMVPGTSMVVSIANGSERKAVVSYLVSLKK